MRKAMKAKAIRVPLAAREVHIIRRLKNIVKLPVTKIAIAVGRDKSTVYCIAPWTRSGKHQREAAPSS